jgi:formate dehydrogenase maturation protein FdhE
MQELYKLADTVGNPAYKAWWERCFEQDGHTADDFTWQQILTAAQIALEHPETLECSCVTPEQSKCCPICQSIAHASVVPEFEG